MHQAVSACLPQEPLQDVGLLEELCGSCVGAVWEPCGSRVGAAPDGLCRAAPAWPHNVSSLWVGMRGSERGRVKECVACLKASSRQESCDVVHAVAAGANQGVRLSRIIRERFCVVVEVF